MQTIRIRSIGLILVAMILATALTAQQSNSTADDVEQALAFQNQMPEMDSEGYVHLHKVIELDLQNAALEEALTAIADQADLKLMYTKALLPEDKIVSYNNSSMTVYDALWEVLDGTDIQFAISQNRQLVLLKMRDVEKVLDQVVQETVSGTVVDAVTGEALPGVNVVVAGSEEATGSIVGTTTNGDGYYEIQVPENSNTLIFTYIGYQIQEIPIDDRIEINVELISGAIVGEELIVIGYGSVQRRDVTGSIGSVSSEHLENLNLTNAEEGFRGSSAGVRVVQTSGAPDSDMTIRIRGTNSALGDNSPLYVIDGLPVEGGLQGVIDPSSIQSMEVLKDASATAIYGSRGANGVVLITTQEGSAGSTVINFKTSIGVNEVTKTINVLNTEQFAMLANEAALNDGRTPELDLNNLPDINTDWQDQIFQRALSQNYNFSLSGGTEETQYSISADIQSSDGAIKESDFNRETVRLNLNQNVNDWLDIKNSYIFGHTVNNRIVGGTSDNIGGDAQGTTVGSTLIAAPLVSPYDETGDYSEMAPYNFIYRPDKQHPLSLVNEVMDKTSRYSFMGNTLLNFDLADNLNAGLRGGVNFRDSANDYFQTSRLLSGTSSGSKNKMTSFYWLAEGTLDYNTQFGINHELNSTAGFSLEKSNSEFLSGSASDFANENLQNNSLQSGANTSPPSNGMSEWSIASLIGRINYSFKNKYLLTITGRYDGSSRLGEENKWGFFPSVAVVWLLSEEGFIRDLDLFSILKLRTSWGVTGNQNIGIYESLTRYISTAGVLDAPSNRVIGFAPSLTLGNTKLKWEETRQYNIGLEVGLLNDRLNFTVDYYDKLTGDLLSNASLAPSSGYSNTTTNIGSVSNKGIEFLVDGVLLRNSNMSWSANATFSVNRNEVINTNNQDQIFGSGHGHTPPITVTMPGHPISSFWGYIKSDLLTEDGFVQFEDLNGDGNISEADKTILGSPHPDFIYSFGTDFSYKGIFANILFEGSQGNDIYNISKLMINDSFSEGKNQTIEMLDRWSPDNSNRAATYPRLGTSTSSEGQTSDQWIEDGSYLKLRSVTIGINLHNLLSNVGWTTLRSARIYLRGTNLLTFTDYSWYDPEVNTFGENDLTFGIERNTYPQTRSYTIGINIGL